MIALDIFLLKNGLDVSSRSGELQQALQPFLLRAWRSSRDQKLKDAFIMCLSIQVRLGGLQVWTLVTLRFCLYMLSTQVHSW